MGSPSRDVHQRIMLLSGDASIQKHFEGFCVGRWLWISSNIRISGVKRIFGLFLLLFFKRDVMLSKCNCTRILWNP